MNEAAKKPYTYRRQDGRYTYSSNWDRMCKCGATLGQHTAEYPHEGMETDCEKFKPVRSKKGAA